MNTNPSATTILCFGDSNTWGQTPDKINRYAADVRWTGQLQKQLGDDFYVDEEGLGSRTTDLDYSKRSGRNGKTYLQPCLASHGPFDVVILMLGTNDFKIEFDRSAADVAQALKGLVQIIQSDAKDKAGAAPKIILVSPISIDENAPHFKEFYTDYYDHESAVKSQQLSAEIQKVAEQTGCSFVDASTVAKSGDDGLHFDEASHPVLGTLLAEKVKELIK